MARAHPKSVPGGVLEQKGILTLEMPPTKARPYVKTVPYLFYTDTENCCLFLDHRAGLGIHAPAERLMMARVGGRPFDVIRVSYEELLKLRASDDSDPRVARKAARYRKRLSLQRWGR
jgi:hypothetical protein